MKAYLQMFKLPFKNVPKIGTSFLILILSVTTYKIFFLKSGSIFSMSDITIAKIIFRVFFTLFIIGSYGLIFGMLRGIADKGIFHLVPEIRKKALIFGFVVIFLIFCWEIFILGFTDTKLLIVAAMFNLWFLSSCMTLYFFDIISVYRSNSFWIFKLIFALLSFIAPMVYAKGPSKHPITYFVIISIFLIVILYQIINFIRNYIGFRLKEDFTREGFGLKMNSLQNIIDNFYARKVVNTIGVVKIKTVKKRYGKLIHITLFGIEFYIPWLFLDVITGLAYVNNVFEMKPRTMFIACVLYSIFFSVTNTPRIFKKKDEIMFLYQKSNIRRDDFELLILKTAMKVYIIRMLKIVIPIFAVVIIYNMYFGYADPYFLIKLILTISAIQLFFIYYFWKTILRNKDYDLLKQSATIRKGLVSLENIIK